MLNIKRYFLFLVMASRRMSVHSRLMKIETTV